MSLAPTGVPTDLQTGAATGRPGDGGLSLPLVGRIRKTHIDFAAWTAWVYLTTMSNTPIDSLLRYMIAGYFFVGVFQHFRDSVPALQKAWPFALVPALYILTAAWGVEPISSIRTGALFFLTIAMGVFLATRLSARQIMLGVMLVELLAGLLSLGVGLGQPAGSVSGIFNQKNQLASNMFMLFLPAAILVQDRGLGPILRCMAAVSVPLALLLIVMSSSATTMIVTILATGALGVHMVVWGPARHVRHLRSFLALLFVAIVSAVCLVLFGFMEFNPMTTILEAFGKDASLTGRTNLWDVARRTMEQHPFGLGANGFWREDSGEANTLIRLYHYGDGYTSFSFHNSYLETGVQIGYPGMWALILAAAWTVAFTLRNWIFNQTLANGYFVILAAVTLVRTQAEIDLSIPLNSTLILFYAGALRYGGKDPAAQTTGEMARS